MSAAPRRPRWSIPLLALVAACGADTASTPSPTEAPWLASPTFACPLEVADLSAGLPEGLDPFDPSQSHGELSFYILVDLTAMDTRVDEPVPSADVPSVEDTPAVVTVVHSTTCRGQIFTDAQVRYKGNTTFDKPKRQFKLSFKRANAMAGYRKLNLHSNWKDATLFREKLAYDLFASAQVPAPRANHALVYVGDTSSGGQFSYQGLYTLVEQVNTDLLERVYGAGNTGGDLYKAYYGWKGSQARGFADLRTVPPGRPEDYRGGNGWADTYDADARAYRLKTNEDEHMEDYSGLATLIDAIDAGGWPGDIDGEGFVSWLAVNTLLGGWDNYWLNAQNYYLYEGNDGLWRWIPWDHDNVLGNNFQDHNGFHIETQDIFYAGFPQNVLIQRALQDDALRASYLSHLESLLESSFTPAAFEAKLSQLASDLGPAAQRDPLKQYDNSLWLGNQTDTLVTSSDEDGEFGNKAHHLGILDYVQRRSDSVRAQLSAARAAR